MPAKNYTSDINVRVSKQTHEEVSKLVRERGMLLGKFVDKAIKEKVDKEKKSKPD
jgi:predicted HicB family RNase H-like nuclease